MLEQQIEQSPTGEYQENLEERDPRHELDLCDQLYLFGHRALGLTERDALEIDPMYHYRLQDLI